MIDIEKFICSLLADHPEGVAVRSDIHKALKEQGLEYKDGKIVPIGDKESEDEKIRKWCISHFRECFRVTKDNVEYQEYLNNKVIPWLERKGEKKPVVIIPKFRVGDVIRLKGSAAEYTIKKVTDTTYYTNGWSYDIERCEEDYELVEQNHDWSEEDERMYKAISIALSFKDAKGYLSSWYKTPEEADNWLNSLKDRVQLQPKQEQEEIVLHWESGHPEPHKSVLILRRHGNVVVEGEWNEETGRWYQYGFQSYLEDNEVDGWMNKKSLLWSFNFRPHWKPSDEQMEYLSAAIEESNENPVIESLYKDLKKLREE